MCHLSQTTPTVKASLQWLLHISIIFQWACLAFSKVPQSALILKAFMAGRAGRRVSKQEIERVSACRILFANALTFTAQHNTWLVVPLCRKRRRRRTYLTDLQSGRVVKCVAVNTLNLFQNHSKSANFCCKREKVSRVDSDLVKTCCDSWVAETSTAGFRFFRWLQCSWIPGLQLSEHTMLPHPSLADFHKAAVFKLETNP